MTQQPQLIPNPPQVAAPKVGFKIDPIKRSPN